MNMIDKIARAMAKQQGEAVFWVSYIEMAKAAIEAMREPTEEMKNIETGSIHYTQVELWNEFINAALKED